MKERLNTEFIKKKIFELAQEYYNSMYKISDTDRFIPGKDKVNYAGRVFDEHEIINLIDSSLEFWLTAGKYTEEFEKKLSDFLGIKYCSMCNSGSSANLLAFMALTSHKLGEKRINKGDEIITVAAGFPTTITPIIQYGAVPVFVDIDIPTYNINCSILEEAVTSKTKAVVLAHTLGNPFEIEKVKEFCKKYSLWLIEDNCDSLGSRYLMNHSYQYTGTFGDLATSSFYPPHHITTGEGGAVYSNNKTLMTIVNSFRDWGRDCWCPSGEDNTCKSRFKWKLGDLPYGYDHKYIYSHFGYNLKMTDMQAAVGCAQIDKLTHFINLRRKNWEMLKKGLKNLEDVFILPEPTPNSEPSWFGFMLTLRDEVNFTRDEIVRYLEENLIQTRMLFAGNLVKQPCFDEMRNRGDGYRIVGELKNTDKVMKDSFWVGVYPGLSEGHIEYIIKKINDFIKMK